MFNRVYLIWFLQFSAFLFAICNLAEFIKLNSHLPLVTISKAELQQANKIEAHSDGTVAKVRATNETNGTRAHEARGHETHVEVQPKNEIIDARSDDCSNDTRTYSDMQPENKTTCVRSKTNVNRIEQVNETSAHSDVANANAQSKNETSHARNGDADIKVQIKNESTFVETDLYAKRLAPEANKTMSFQSDAAEVNAPSKNENSLARSDEADLEAQIEIKSTHSDSDASTKGMEPVWKCNDSPESRRRTKFVFVHVFKTAGSSIRTFLQEYSRACHTGYGALASCTNVNRESMFQSESHNWKDCQLYEVVDRHGKCQRPGKLNNALLQNNLDIVAGHLRLGAADHLVDEKGMPCNIRYLSFFRNAVAKFVSSKVYIKMRSKHQMTREQVLNHIRNQVRNDVANGIYYSKYDHYLLTPLQKEQIAGQNMTMHDTAILIMRNLVDYNVIVGIVERMPESMEMLSHLLDGDGSAKEVFGMGNKSSRRQQYKENQSPVSASAMLAKLQKDDEFHRKLMEYVKYEQMITEFAMELHMKQYKAIKNLS